MFTSGLDPSRWRKAAFVDEFLTVVKGMTSSCHEWRIVVLGLTVVAVPQFFQAGQSRISGVYLESMFM